MLKFYAIHYKTYHNGTYIDTHYGEILAEDGTVKAKIDWHDRSGNGDKAEFEADVSFMFKLQEIVSKYDLAKHNGYTHHVSGLPDMFGEQIDIKYASGESIYAHDNQDGFLPMDAMVELIELFSGKTSVN